MKHCGLTSLLGWSVLILCSHLTKWCNFGVAFMAPNSLINLQPKTIDIEKWAVSNSLDFLQFIALHAVWFQKSVSTYLCFLFWSKAIMNRQWTSLLHWSCFVNHANPSQRNVLASTCVQALCLARGNHAFGLYLSGNTFAVGFCCVAFKLCFWFPVTFCFVILGLHSKSLTGLATEWRPVLCK